MIKPNVNIVNFNSLYEILHEVKDNLSFDITKYGNENDFLKDEKSKSKNSLIIVKSNNEILSEKTCLILDDLPMSLIKLIELININLIRLKFNHQSKVNIKGYELNLNSKFFSKDNIVLKLTEKEIEVILYLDTNKDKHNVLDLQKNIWGYTSELETHTVETHIYRLRKKIHNTFKDKNFIMSHKQGYYIE
ncbi:winged helix-turn-helix domain-containing protein [Candidatus Pelagibacter sp.]|nr:winged helix-turn-helix domain-containing protein [Candidatus Pelagibacter sp.]